MNSRQSGEHDAYTFDERQIRLLRWHRPPMLMLDAISSCSAKLDYIEAVRLIGSGEPMLVRAGGSPAIFPSSMILEALAQASGFLKTLRWLAAQACDVANFAVGDDSALCDTQGAMLAIPYSVFAESRLKVHGTVGVGDSLQLCSRVILQHQHSTRFSAEAHTVKGLIISAEITLAYPQ